jgi:hypothetical protein
VINNPVAVCYPLPYGRHATPSKKDDGALEGKTNNYATPVQGQHRDVRPAGPVTSVAIGPVRPSPPSPRHTDHCITFPDAVEACDDGTPPHQLLCPRTTSRQRHPRVLTRAVAEHETSTPPPSKPLLDAPCRPARSKIRQDVRLLRGDVHHASTRRQNSVARL